MGTEEEEVSGVEVVDISLLEEGDQGVEDIFLEEEWVFKDFVVLEEELVIRELVTKVEQVEVRVIQGEFMVEEQGLWDMEIVVLVGVSSKVELEEARAREGGEEVSNRSGNHAPLFQEQTW